MTDAQFFNSFEFNLVERQRHFVTDNITPTGSPHHFFARLLSGTARIRTDSETLQLRPGDVFYIPKGLKYRSCWHPDTEIIRFYSFGFDFFPAEAQTVFKLQILPCTGKARELLTELEQDPTVNALSIGRLYRFLGEICPQMQTDLPEGNRVIVSRALEFMRRETGSSVAEVAQYCGISESSLFVNFRKHLNRTPVEVRHSILTEKAAELLRTTDMTVEQVSEQLGFSSSSYFRKVFREQTGQTPIEFRKQTRLI